MYEMTLYGNTCWAKYTLSAKTDAFVLEKCMVTDPDEKSDCLSVVITDQESPSNLQENWMVLSGTPWQIVQTIHTKYPVAKLASHEIFEVLDKVGTYDEIIITYPTEEPGSIIRNSNIHRAMRRHQRAMVSRMFDTPAERVYLIALRGREGQ